MYPIPVTVGSPEYAKVGAISNYPHFSGLANEDPDIFFKNLRRRLILKNVDPNLWAQVGVECLDGTTRLSPENTT